MTFEIGQKVKIIGCSDRGAQTAHLGQIVTVVGPMHNDQVPVEFSKDKPLYKGAAMLHSCHDGDKRWSPSFRGFWVNLEEIQPIVIVGKTVQNYSYQKNLLPTDSAERKKIPIVTGCLDYFSAALAEVAKVSYAGNEQHNPGQPLHWSRGKSADHADTIGRHLLERGGLDIDGMRHSAKMAWRALAILQLELEAEGAPVARGAKCE